MDSDDRLPLPVAYDSETGEYRVQYDVERDSPTVAVVGAFAAAEGVEPTALEPLGDAVDLDALERLVSPRGGDSDVRAQFPVRAYRVTVDSDGLVTLRTVESDATSADATA